MTNPFFEHPILNSPYAYPARHWELDDEGQPTQQILESRRRAAFITPIPKPRKRKGSAAQQQIVFDEGQALSTQEQPYDHTAIINAVRQQVDQWRSLPNPQHWHVTPETARLLQHWRHHQFGTIRPFFCQVEAIETAIWLTEVAPSAGNAGKSILEHLANANHDANPELMRLALKLATGAGKTTVMAMLIAWQTINAVRRPHSNTFTRGFLIVAPGLTIRPDGIADTSTPWAADLATHPKHRGGTEQAAQSTWICLSASVSIPTLSGLRGAGGLVPEIVQAVCENTHPSHAREDHDLELQ